jgi:hypothetical protein
MREVLRVQVLALHPLKVFGIVAGLALTLAWIHLVGALAGMSDKASAPVVAEEFAMLQRMLTESRVDLLAAVFAGLCVVWAVLGGAVTRRMARDLAGQPHESVWAALRFCCTLPLLLPSALATSCLILLIIAPAHPWALLAVLPVWLYAGFLYGPLVERHLSLREALCDAHGRLAQGRKLLRLQATYLAGFACSTGLVYLVAAAWVLLVSTILPGVLAWVFALPVALYALGYTTANLKSLQLHLYRQLETTDDHR